MIEETHQWIRNESIKLHKHKPVKERWSTSKKGRKIIDHIYQSYIILFSIVSLFWDWRRTQNYKILYNAYTQDNIFIENMIYSD